MVHILRLILTQVALSLRSRAELQFENLALRHQIEILKRTNFCTTYAALPSNLRVRHNLHIFARLYGVGDPRGKTAELLELLEIPHLADKVTGHLSAGESTVARTTNS